MPADQDRVERYVRNVSQRRHIRFGVRRFSPDEKSDCRGHSSRRAQGDEGGDGVNDALAVPHSLGDVERFQHRPQAALVFQSEIPQRCGVSRSDTEDGAPL